MSSNSFGQIFKVHSFGESHGLSMGVVIEGCPSGVSLSVEDFKKELDRRKPGKWPWNSSRKEPDEPEILSGVFEGKTLGTPIAIEVKNRDARSQDYDKIKKEARRGHADDLWKEKFKHWDHRGGGRASGRETVSRVLAGVVARAFIQQVCPDFQVMAFVREIGDFSLEEKDLAGVEKLFQKKLTSEEFPACFPHAEKSQEVIQKLMEAKKTGRQFGFIG